MGITHHAHGVENVQAIGNLALLRGMVGRPGCGLLPIRGHSNVQGIGSMGVTPKLKDAVFERLQDSLRRAAADDAGPRHDELHGPARPTGELKVGFCLGGNLYGSNPDATFAAEALGKLDLLVYLNTTLNTGHAYGLARETIILPVLARDEEPQATTQESMFNFVRLSDGGPRRHDGPRSEVDVIAIDRRGRQSTRIVAARLGGDATARPQIRQAIAHIVPGLREDRGDRPHEGRVSHRRAARSTSRASPRPTARPGCTSTSCPNCRAAGDGELRVMTIRSEASSTRSFTKTKTSTATSTAAT